MQEKAKDPISLLRDIERRVQGDSNASASAQLSSEVWRGIGFSVGDRRLVSSMADITEVMHLPKLARVPGAKEWLMGIANLRGALLPVMNLHGFLRGESATLGRDARVLVIEKDEILSGLAVEEVFGVKHFLDEQRLPDAAASESWLAPYVVGSFHAAEQTWEVFDVHALIDAPAFMQVAA
ncbi:MAG: chemotaxis protein CheW [Gammaproteobacteria bacterium]|nr:purine-binding chemotaxis protein CheW [Gammaproteobacteria bacterium]NIR23012.1 purine-binding chemotaxis protein CheW [Gammaproteobacteria bacterium]NIS04285.1 purine-binding chemotaxis protein CheW [Gammaproteobacteria bacterium]NIV46468.1 chemotaxis protein CheW [Gammaproteobacteria bacterium]NIW01501.1 chemotaxis protein CheW [Gammaproteobacteria bacterium]